MIWTDTPALMTCWNDSNYIGQGLPEPQDRVHRGPASVDRERLRVRRHHPAGGHQVRARATSAWTTTPPSSARSSWTRSASSRWASPRATTRCCCAIAEKLGLLEEFTGGKSVDEWIRVGFDTSGVDDLVSWEEFNEKGHYVIPNDPDWQKHEVGAARLRRRPGRTTRSARPPASWSSSRSAWPTTSPMTQERPPVPALGGARPQPRRAHRRRPGQDIPLPVPLQPSALAGALAARRHAVAARDPDLQDRRAGRLRLPDGLDPSRRRRGARACRPATWSRSSTSGARCWWGPTSPSA